MGDPPQFGDVCDYVTQVNQRLMLGVVNGRIPVIRDSLSKQACRLSKSRKKHMVVF